jgi:tetratricopeptide (TPR) repeat protein
MSKESLRAGAAENAEEILRVVLCVLCVLCAKPLFADQYQSEVRELPGTPPPQQQQDPQKLLQGAKDPYEKAMLLRELAAKAVGDKDYEAAAKYLDQAIRQNALSAQATAEMRKDLTQLLVAGGKPSDVVRTLEPQVRNNPNATAEQRAALGGAYLQLKRYKDALPLLQAAVASSPNPDESWLQALYAAYSNSGRQKEAVPVLEKLVRKNPGQREYWIALASTLHQTGNKERALAVLELASRQGHLQSPEERLQLVGLTAQLGAPFEAGSLMHAWLKDGQLPRTAANYETLAGLWLAARESQLAVGALNDAQKIGEDPGRSLQLGQLHMDQDDYAAAALELNEGLGDARTDRAGPVLLALGVASFNSGNVDGAREAFTGAQRFPKSADAAAQWLKFLDSAQAREQATRLARRKAQGPEQVALSGRLLGGAVTARPSGPGADIVDTKPDLRRIGGRLTEVGAERDGNADGSIPAWSGGLTQPPPGFKKGGRLVDPYPNDKPLFTITTANAAQYAAKLSPGHKALLSKYPSSFRMPVYETRRSAAFPQAIYDATQANLGKARLIGSDALTNARLGFPFPQPQNGVEVMWNHRTRYRGDTFMGVTSQAVVSKGGVGNRNKGVFRVLFRYGNVARPADIEDENIIVYGVTFVGERVTDTMADFVVLFHESANSIKKSRAIWVLLGKIGRMLRLPPLGYDQPMYGTEGIYFIDMIDMYNGAFDRYVWKLVGKRELYVPYNAYRLDDGSQKYAQQLTWPTFNAQNARYELHRVWVIEATERGGKTHVFGKRTFYVDEDSWNVVLVENQDRAGKLWRFQEGHLVTSYDVGSTNAYPIVTYDFKDDRYFVHRLLAEDPPLQFNVPMRDAEFLPASVQAKYSR